MIFKTLIPLLFLFGTAHAVEYTLPSGPDVALAQLQSVELNYSTVCDTNTVVDSPCDVEPGLYQLVVYNAVWSAERSEVIIETDSSDSGSDDTGSGPRIDLVTESCFGAPNSEMGCTATCPVGSVATGGACDVSDGFSVTSVAGDNFYRCPTALPPNDSSVGVTASVYCLSAE